MTIEAEQSISSWGGLRNKTVVEVAEYRTIREGNTSTRPFQAIIDSRSPLDMTFAKPISEDQLITYDWTPDEVRNRQIFTESEIDGVQSRDGRIRFKWRPTMPGDYPELLPGQEVILQEPLEFESEDDYVDSEPMLPAGVKVEDLRFVHPQLYPLDMVTKGWQALLRANIDENPAKMSYSLLRAVAEDLDVESLKRDVGMVAEDGTPLPGYLLAISDDPEAEKTLARQMGAGAIDILDSEGRSQIWQGEGRFLIFNFTGFPTSKTMDVLLALEKKFLPKSFRPYKIEL